MLHRSSEASVRPKREPLEALFFGSLNAAIEPLVRAGLAPPLPCPHSLIVLETRGRTTGKLRRTPLVATIVGDLAVIGTFRAHHSQWIRNAAVSPNLRYFRSGRVREAQDPAELPLENAFAMPRARLGPEALPRVCSGLNSQSS